MTLPPEAHRLQPDHLPTPFSAEQIRAGCPPGRTIHLREETAGESPTFRRIRFMTTDANGGAQELQATDPEGHPIGEPRTGHSTWLDLQRHASNPVEGTTIEEVALSLPFGDFDCWLYVVHGSDSELRFWFAKELPGMPVQVEDWSGGELVGRTSMISIDGPATRSTASTGDRLWTRRQE
jgi:hypothetical protein